MPETSFAYFRTGKCGGYDTERFRTFLMKCTNAPEREISRVWAYNPYWLEFERGLITERTRAGVTAAYRRGVKSGPKFKLTPEQIKHAREQIEGGKGVQEVADLLNVGRVTLWRNLKED